MSKSLFDYLFGSTSPLTDPPLFTYKSESYTGETTRLNSDGDLDTETMSYEIVAPKSFWKDVARIGLIRDETDSQTLSTAFALLQLATQEITKNPKLQLALVTEEGEVYRRINL